ncbi:MAG: FkbM family methyltransferase [Xanthobacteraceae bacterium]
MKSPYNSFESDPLAAAGGTTAGGLSFLRSYEVLIDALLTSPTGVCDPRARINMPPEPYRPAPELNDKQLREGAIELVRPNLAKWNLLYQSLADDASKRLLLVVLAYRSLGWKYVRMPLDNDAFWALLGELAGMAESEGVPPFLLEKGLRRFNLANLDRDVVVYTEPFGVFNEFYYAQYHYRGMKRIIAPEPGDYVIDCGACFGGTSLNFADMVGPRGRVYSFEFLPENLHVFHHNLHENINLLHRISLAVNPVWSQSGLTMSIVGSGPGAQVHVADVDGAQKVQSAKIDDFVTMNGLPKVNFIKMDIEGAEIEALKGAMGTIERHRPKLAICVYHDLTHFYEVPRLLSGIHDDYRFYFGHSSTHGDESVIFAV